MSANVVRFGQPGYSDRTDRRILAFLASVQPFEGSVEDETFHRGRSLVERMAISSTDEDNPAIRLSVDQCADVLFFLCFAQPLEPRDWWIDPEDAPSHVVGWMFVLGCLEASLRK